MHLLIGVARPARQLWQLTVRPEERELVVVVLAGLFLHVLEVDRALVDAYRSAGFHPCLSHTPSLDAFGEVVDGGFGAASALDFPSADVHEAVEEGAGGDDDGPGAEFHAPYCSHSYDRPRGAVDEELVGLVLEDVEVRGVVEDMSPLPDELPAVALCPRTPHCRSFRAVEHTELDGGGVGDKAHLSAEGVDLAYNLSLGYSADGRIAAHLPYLVHVHRYQTRLRTDVGGGRGGLTTGVATSDN